MTKNKKANINNMIEQLRKAEFFLECVKELNNKLNEYDNKNKIEEESEENE